MTEKKTNNDKSINIINPSRMRFILLVNHHLWRGSIV